MPLWLLYPLFFVVVYLSHWRLLRLPFFWDEGGYYIPAALDFFHTGSMIPSSTLTNAHPPLPSILLAGWWHLSGYVISETRTFVCMISAAALLGVFRLARMLAGSAIAAVVTLLTAMYPVWFVQSTLAHADIFAAAFTLWALSFYFERFPYADHSRDAAQPSASKLWKILAAAILFSFAALSKETAIVTPGALGVWEAVLLLTERSDRHTPRSIRWMLALFMPVLPLAGWYGYHFHKTGFAFGNPEFLRYNATANLSATRILISAWHRTIHLTVHMNLYVPVVATLAILVMPRLAGRTSWVTPKPVMTALAVVVAGNAIAFSVLGGALLTRYLLPLYPLVLLLCVTIWHERLRAWWGLAVLTGFAFLAGLWINPPYSFAPEDNLTYRDMIVLHQQAVHVIEERFPAATVLTAWPATTELEHPLLGYVRHPIKVASVENFSLPEMQRAAADPGAYDTALLFSTKWTPAPGMLNLGRASESTDTRLYDFHHDVSPIEAAALLHGEVAWQARRGGEWVAVLRFPRSNEATVPERKRSQDVAGNVKAL